LITVYLHRFGHPTDLWTLCRVSAGWGFGRLMIVGDHWFAAKIVSAPLFVLPLDSSQFPTLAVKPITTTSPGLGHQSKVVSIEQSSFRP